MEKQGGEVSGSRGKTSWKLRPVDHPKAQRPEAPVCAHSFCECGRSGRASHKALIRVEPGPRPPGRVRVGPGWHWPQAGPRGHLRTPYVQDDGLETAVNSWPVGLSQDRPPKQVFCRREQVSKAAESQGVAGNLCHHHPPFCP